MADDRKKHRGGGTAEAPEERNPGRPAGSAGGGASPSGGPTGTSTTAHQAGKKDEGVTDKARDVKESAKAAAADAKERAGAGAQKVKEQAREKGRELRDEAERKADRWTDGMGARVDHVAHALRAASESLESEGEDALAEMVEDAARQVDRVGGYLEGEDPSSMMSDFRDLGRRNPGVFLGGALLVGLAAGRFLRASEPNGHEAHPAVGRTRSTAPTSQPRDPIAGTRRRERPVGASSAGRETAVQRTPAGALEAGERPGGTGARESGRPGGPGESARPAGAASPTREGREGGGS